MKDGRLREADLIRIERAQVRREKRRRSFPPARPGAALMRSSDGRFYQRDDEKSATLRRVTVANAAPIERPKAERGPAEEPSIREQIRAAGVGARALYESMVARHARGSKYSPSRDTQRKWLRAVEETEAYHAALAFGGGR